MIRYSGIIVLFAAFLTIPLNIYAEQPGADFQPRAVLPENEYNFGKVMEGTLVRHEFLLKNHGPGPLKIIKVDAG